MTPAMARNPVMKGSSDAGARDFIVTPVPLKPAGP